MNGSLFDAVREAEVYVAAEAFNTTSVNANAARIMGGLLDLLRNAESEQGEERELRVKTVQAVLDLMHTAQHHFDSIEPDVLIPYGNGYSTWFIGLAENFSDGQMMGTAPLSVEAIVDRIEARDRG